MIPTPMVIRSCAESVAPPRSDLLGHGERLAVLAPEVAVGFGVGDETLTPRVEAQLAAKPVGDVGEQAETARDVPFLELRVEQLAPSGAQRGDEVGVVVR